METEAKKQRGSRVARIAAVVFLGLTTLLVLGLFIARLWLSEERILRVAEREIADAIAGDLQIGAFEWDDFPTGAVFEDFVLRDLDDRVVVSVDRARIELEPVGLLGRSVRASRIDLEGAEVRLLQGEAGAFSILEALARPELVGEPGSDNGWDVFLERVNLTGGRVEMETAQGLLLLEGMVIEDSTLRLEAGELVAELDVFAEEARLVRPGQTDAVATSVRIEGLRVLRPADGAPDAVTVSVEKIEADQVQVDGFSARLEGAGGTYDGRSVRLEELLLDLFPGTLNIRGEVDLSGPDPILDLEVVLRGVPLRELAGEWIDPRLLPDRVEGQARLEGLGLSPPVGRFQATLQATGLPAALLDAVPEDARAFLPSGARIVVAAEIDSRRISFESLDIAAPDIRILAQGSVPLAEGAPFDLSFQATHAALAPLLAALGLPVSAAEVALDGDLSGVLPLPNAEAVLTAGEISLGPLVGGTLRAPMRLEEGVLYLERALLTAPLGRAEVQGQVALFDAQGRLRPDPPIRGRAAISELDLSSLDDTGSAEGSLAMMFELGGSLGSPSVEGRVESQDLRLLGAAFDAASASIAADPSKIRLVALELTPSDGGLIRGTGRLDLDEESMLLALELRELPASLFFAPVDPALEIEGSVDGLVELVGPLSDPRLEASLTSEFLSIEAMPMGRVEALAAGDLGSMDVEVTVEGASGRLHAEGTLLPRERRIDALSLRAEDLLFQQMPWANRLPLTLAGRASVELSAEGDLSSPRVFGLLEIDDLSIDGRLVHRGRLQSRVGPLEDGALAIGISVPGVLFVRVRLVPGPPLEIEAWGDIEGFQLAWVLPGLAEAEIDARLVGRGELRYRRDPTELSASLLLPEFELTMADQTLSANRPVTLRYQDETFILEDLELEGPAGSFQAGGAIGPDIDFISFGLVDAALLAVLLPQIVRAEGTLAVDLRVLGSADAPQVTGNLDVVETVSLLPRGMLREVVVESLSATLIGDRLDLAVLTGNITGSPFLANGYLILDGFQPTQADFSVLGEGLPIRAADLTGEVNVDLRVTSAEERILVSGRVDAVRGRYLRDLTFTGFSLVTDQAVGPPREPSPLLEILDLDLRVVSVGAVDALADAGAFGLDVVLDADLRVSGSAAAPRLEGRVASARGVLRTPRADLPIVRGFVDFVPLPGNPMRAIIDLLAEGEVLVPPGGRDPTASYFLALSLEGELEEISLELVSQPPLDRLEILALLVTGQVAPRGLVPGNGRHVESAFVFAGTRLAQPLTRMVTERLEEVLNLEVLAADVTTEGIAITAGAEVSRRLRLEGSLQQGFGDTGAMALARARFLLSNFVFLEASAQSVDEGGATVVPREREGSRGTLEIRARLLGGR